MTRVCRQNLGRVVTYHLWVELERSSHFSLLLYNYSANKLHVVNPSTLTSSSLLLTSSRYQYYDIHVYMYIYVWIPYVYFYFPTPPSPFLRPSTTSRWLTSQASSWVWLCLVSGVVYSGFSATLTSTTCSFSRWKYLLQACCDLSYALAFSTSPFYSAAGWSWDLIIQR